MDVVVVESPAKAKTINKYLGSDFAVYASYGHVRDLPAKNGSVDPEKDFNMIWQIDDKSNGHLKQIAKAAKGATNLYLATDPDREGEAISWHVLEILKNQKVLDGVDVKRIVFHEITQEAVLTALRSPREFRKTSAEPPPELRQNFADEVAEGAVGYGRVPIDGVHMLRDDARRIDRSRSSKSSRRGCGR